LFAIGSYKESIICRDWDAGIESLQNVDDPHSMNETEMHLSTKYLKELQKDI